MGQYSTNPDHMPKNHQLYGEWDADRFLRWAGDIGPFAKEVVERIFASYRVEEQAYKGCLSLLKLADKYSSDRPENAYRVALAHIPSPRYKNIRLILEAGQGLPKNEELENTNHINRFTHLRRASYYGGGRHEFETYQKLRHMRLPAFAQGYKEQSASPKLYASMPSTNG